MFIMFVGDRHEIPKLCLSAIILKSDTGEYILKQQRRNCSATLEWFVCKNGTVILLHIRFNIQYILTKFSCPLQIN